MGRTPPHHRGYLSPFLSLAPFLAIGGHSGGSLLIPGLSPFRTTHLPRVQQYDLPFCTLRFGGQTRFPSPMRSQVWDGRLSSTSERKWSVET